MSVNNEDEVDSNMLAILNQLKLIDQNHRERQAIYQSCLTSYLHHLNLQTQHLTKSQPSVEKRNKNISQSFELVYDSIYEGADRALRSIRRTYQSKQNFWSQTISQSRDSENLQFKAQLYSLMRDAEYRFEQAIEARKNIKKNDFRRVFAKKQADRALLSFQQTNQEFQGKVYLGTHTSSKWKPLQNTYLNSANKQNEAFNAKTARNHSNKRQESGEDILNNFVRK